MKRVIWKFTLFTLCINAYSTIQNDCRFFFLLFRENKAWYFLWIVCSARQIIHMKCQNVFSWKKKKKKYFSVSSTAVVTGALKVKVPFAWHGSIIVFQGGVSEQILSWWWLLVLTFYLQGPTRCHSRRKVDFMTQTVCSKGFLAAVKN